MPLAPGSVSHGSVAAGVAERYEKVNGLMLVPVGSTERHGSHAPLSTDVLIPQEVCRRVATAQDGLVAPPINYGLSDAHVGFAGLARIIHDGAR
jgi:creatinine amidohydrolase/Fe(II)-dependent formamide hydrolase-like protein